MSVELGTPLNFRELEGAVMNLSLLCDAWCPPW